MALDKITVDRIATLHPDVREQVLVMYTHCNEKILGKGVRLRFAQALRTIEEQNKIFAQGRTESGNIVTNAKGGSSYHNYGLAFDIVLLYDKDNNGTFETASWEMNSDFKKVKDYIVSQGWEWGGSWKSFKDYPHFQLTQKDTTGQMKAKVEGKDNIREVRGGIEYVYPKLK